MEYIDWISIGSLILVVLTFWYAFIFKRFRARYTFYRGFENTSHIIITNYGDIDIPIVSIEVSAYGKPTILIRNDDDATEDNKLFDINLFHILNQPEIIKAGEVYDLRISDELLFQPNLSLADLLAEEPTINMIVVILTKKGVMKYEKIELLKKLEGDFESLDQLKEHLLNNFHSLKSGMLTKENKWF